MNQSVAIAKAIAALLPLVTTGAQSLVNFIEEIRGSAQQTGEWTEEAEQAYRSSLIASGQSPAAQPDPELPAGTESPLNS